MIQDIERHIARGQRLHGSEVRGWLKTDDLESMGAVMYLLYEHTHLLEEMPPLEPIVDLALRFYERCLRENPDGEYTSTRYLAGHELVHWYRMMRRDEQVPRSVLARAREMLRRVYEEGDAETKKAVIQGALEHLLETPEVRADFEEWRRDPKLRAAYLEALEWSEGPA